MNSSHSSSRRELLAGAAALGASAVFLTNVVRAGPRIQSAGRALRLLDFPPHSHCGAISVSPCGRFIAFAAGDADAHGLYVAELEDFVPRLIFGADTDAQQSLIYATGISADCRRIAFCRIRISAENRTDDIVEVSAVDGTFCCDQLPDTTINSATTLGLARDGTVWKEPTSLTKWRSGSLAVIPSVAGETKSFAGMLAGIDTISLTGSEVLLRKPVDLGAISADNSPNDHVEFAVVSRYGPDQAVVYSVSMDGSLRIGPSEPIGSKGTRVIAACAGHGYLAYVEGSGESDRQVVRILNSGANEISSLTLSASKMSLLPQAFLPDGTLVMTAVMPDIEAPKSQIAVW